RSPYQWPGTARSAASAGRSLIMAIGVVDRGRPDHRAAGAGAAPPLPTPGGPAPTPPIIRPAGASGRRRGRPAAPSGEPPPLLRGPGLAGRLLGRGLLRRGRGGALGGRLLGRGLLRRRLLGGRLLRRGLGAALGQQLRGALVGDRLHLVALAQRGVGLPVGDV